MNETSGVLLLVPVPILVAGAVELAQRPALGFRSKHPVNIATLPAFLNRFAPSVAPVLAKNGGRYGLMNDAPPENAWAQCQEEFAAWHNLTSRQTLDREACETVFVAQLGARLHEDEAFLPACWAAHERALLAVIGLQVFCNDRQGAARLADDLNRNYLQRGLLRRRIDPLPLWRLCEVPLQRVLAAPGMTDWLAMHVSLRSALAGVYGRDLRLPSVCFAGRPGIRCTAPTRPRCLSRGQAHAERYAHRLGLPQPGVIVMTAVDGLQADLESIGLVHPREPVAASRARRDNPQGLVGAFSIASGSEGEA